MVINLVAIASGSTSRFTYLKSEKPHEINTSLSDVDSSCIGSGIGLELYASQTGVNRHRVN